jgi:outer membrane protein assembly factor BamA
MPAICIIILLAFAGALANVSNWKVRVTGADVFSEKFLIQQLDLPEEMDVISPERRGFIIKLAKGNLDDFYQSNGYFSENITLSLSEEMVDTVRVEIYTFDVFEGERYMFGNANIIFAKGSDSLIGTEKFAVPKGGFYDPEHISNDKKSIRGIYQRNGYLHISVEHLEYIDTVEKKVNVHYFTDPKHQVRMGDFKSKVFRSGLLPGQTEPEVGLSDTAWLNSLWEIPRDSIVNERYFFSFRTKLFSTQLFSQVQLVDSLREDGLSDIILTAYERVPGVAEYGFFFEQVYGFGISVSSMHRNLSGSFHEVGVGAMIAENRQELSLRYAHPLLFGTSVDWIPTAIRLEERIIFNHEKLPAPTKPDSLVERWEVINRANLSFGFWLTDMNVSRIRTRSTLDFRYLKLQGVNYFKLKGEIGFTFDFTDNSFDPILGFRFVPSVGAGGELKHDSFDRVKGVRKFTELLNIGVEHGFLYTDASIFAYIPISRRHLLSAFAFSYGNVFNNAAVDDAQTFYQGGGRTLRGYRFRTVFPSKTVISLNEETGEMDTTLFAGLSPQYFRINEELRLIPPFRSLRSFQLVQFTDWVHINDSDKSFNSAQEMSVGFGLRYKWQFLTFRLDYALITKFQNFKLDKFSFSYIVFDLSQAI